MSTNHTPNYNLCQWEKTDAVLRTDFNEDNKKLDEALRLKGNCAIDCRYYPGQDRCGENNKNQVFLDFIPTIIILFDRTTGKFCVHYSSSGIGLSPWFPNSPIMFSDGYIDNKDGTYSYVIRWYSDTAEHQFDISGHGYIVAGIKDLHP